MALGHGLFERRDKILPGSYVRVGASLAPLKDVAGFKRPVPPVPPREETFRIWYRVADVSGQIDPLELNVQYVRPGEDGGEVTASARQDYNFIGWSDGVMTANRQELNVQADIEVFALFEPVEVEFFVLTYLVDGGGSLVGVTVQRVAAGGYGSMVQAFADEGWFFMGWDDGEQLADRADGPVSANLTVTALFAQAFTLQYMVQGLGSGDVSSVFIVGENPQSVLPGADGSPVEWATAYPGFFEFVQWSDGRTDNPRQDTNVAESKYLWAEWRQVPAPALFIYLYYVSADAVGGGLRNVGGDPSLDAITIIRNGYRGLTAYGVEAFPRPGYTFVGWSDGVVSPVRYDTYIEHAAYFAYFAPADDPPAFVTVAYFFNDGYSLDFSRHYSLRKAYGTVTTFEGTLITEPGYEFSHWSDGVTVWNRVDDFTVNKHVTAFFNKVS